MDWHRLFRPGPERSWRQMFGTQGIPHGMVRLEYDQPGRRLIATDSEGASATVAERVMDLIGDALDGQLVRLHADSTAKGVDDTEVRAWLDRISQRPWPWID